MSAPPDVDRQRADRDRWQRPDPRWAERAPSPSSSPTRRRRPPDRRTGRGRLAGRGHPRQRPAGRVHPAALGVGRPATCIPRLSLDMAVRGLAGRRRLHRRQLALLNELGRPGLADRVGLRADPDRRRPPTIPPSRARPSRSVRIFSATEAADASRRMAGRWSRTPAAATGASSPRRARCGSSKRHAIHALLEAGFVVVAAGGGGIPVVEERPGVYRGVEAVVDKDLASALPGGQSRRPIFGFFDRCRECAVRFRQPDQRFLDGSRSPKSAGTGGREFPEGSMGPKIRCGHRFSNREDRRSSSRRWLSGPGRAGRVLTSFPMKESGCQALQAEPYEFEFDPQYDRAPDDRHAA